MASVDSTAVPYKPLRPTIRPEALTATVYDIVPTIAAPHSTSINAIAATPDLRWVFSGGTDGYIRKFDWVDTANAKVALTVAQKHPFVDSVTKAGVLLSYWENEESQLRSPTAQQADEDLSLSPVYALAVHSQGLWLLSGLDSGGINLQSVRHDEGKRIIYLKRHTSAVSVLTLTGDEKSVLSGSWDKTVCDWDLNTGQVRQVFNGSGGQISAIELRPTSSLPVPQAMDEAMPRTNGTFSATDAERLSMAAYNARRTSIENGGARRREGAALRAGAGAATGAATEFASAAQRLPEPVGGFGDGGAGAGGNGGVGEADVNGDQPSPGHSLFSNDADSLFGDYDDKSGGGLSALPGDGGFPDDDDEFSRAIASGLQQQDEEMAAAGDVRMADASLFEGSSPPLATAAVDQDASTSGYTATIPDMPDATGMEATADAPLPLLPNGLLSSHTDAAATADTITMPTTTTAAAMVATANAANPQSLDASSGSSEAYLQQQQLLPHAPSPPPASQPLPPSSLLPPPPPLPPLPPALNTWHDHAAPAHAGAGAGATPAPATSDAVFLAASHDGTLRVWDRRQAAPVARIAPKSAPPWCMGACWSPDGNTIYAGRRNGTVEEYSLHRGLGRPERVFKFPQGSGAVSAVRAMPNGRHLICASFDILRLYDLLDPHQPQPYRPAYPALDGNPYHAHHQQQHQQASAAGAATAAATTTSSSIVPFLIIPGHRGGVISALHIDPACRYLISAAGNRGWEGSSTEVLLGYEINAM